MSSGLRVGGIGRQASTIFTTYKTSLRLIRRFRGGGITEPQPTFIYHLLLSRLYLLSLSAMTHLVSIFDLLSSLFSVPSIVNLLPSIFYLLSSISYPLSSIFYPLSSIFYRLYFICYLLSSMFYLLYIF